MKQRLTIPPEDTSSAVDRLSHAEMLLDRARQIIHGAPDEVDLSVTATQFGDYDYITVTVDPCAQLEQRCHVVDWFAQKLGVRPYRGRALLGESGYASYVVDAEFGASRKCYVHVYTQTAKAAA